MAEDGLAHLQPEIVMAATQHSFDDEEPADTAAALSRVDARKEDAYWHGVYWRERYYSPGRDYEDYAPAYCVGYIGFAQYGGEFGDAERSLWANWERIKGDSQLLPDEARLAMRAAWDRMAARRSLHIAKRASLLRLFRQRLNWPSLKPGGRIRLDSTG
jgi:hypothetical protein